MKIGLKHYPCDDRGNKPDNNNDYTSDDAH